MHKGVGEKIKERFAKTFSQTKRTNPGMYSPCLSSLPAPITKTNSRSQADKVAYLVPSPAVRQEILKPCLSRGNASEHELYSEGGGSRGTHHLPTSRKPGALVCPKPAQGRGALLSASTNSYCRRHRIAILRPAGLGTPLPPGVANRAGKKDQTLSQW